MSFAGYTAVLCTTAGRFACCWLAHNAVHSPTIHMTIVDTSTVLNLEEKMIQWCPSLSYLAVLNQLLMYLFSHASHHEEVITLLVMKVCIDSFLLDEPIA